MSRLFLLAVVAVALLACLVSVEAQPSPCFKPWTADEVAMKTYGDNARVANGRARLKFTTQLGVNARKWATTMAAQNYLRHQSFTTMLSYISGWTQVGENIGYNYSPLAQHNGWWNSPGHKANMLNSAFTHVGVGAAYRLDSYGRRQMWSVVIFIRHASINTLSPPLCPAYADNAPELIESPEPAAGTQLEPVAQAEAASGEGQGEFGEESSASSAPIAIIIPVVIVGAVLLAVATFFAVRTVRARKEAQAASAGVQMQAV